MLFGFAIFKTFDFLAFHDFLIHTKTSFLNLFLKLVQCFKNRSFIKNFPGTMFQNVPKTGTIKVFLLKR